MIIYQVVCTVPVEIEQEWKEWMLGEHIRDVMNTELFYAYRLSRVVKPALDTATMYSIQYLAHTLADYERYRLDFADVLQAAAKAKFGSEILIERAVLEMLEES